MLRSKSLSSLGERRSRRRQARPVLESLEPRTVLSSSSVSVDISAAALNPSPMYTARQAYWQPVIGTISGAVTNAAGAGLRGVRVQLIDANGDVVANTTSGVRGNYKFAIRQDGPYVVREVTPPRFTQTSPTFAYTAPVGSYATNPATGTPYTTASWSYDTGNSNPAFGPVGVYAWDTVAPAGDLPFESPINITVPPIDLSPYLTVNYNSIVPKAIVNNGYQIQTQLSGSSSDTVTVGGQTFELAQFHFHDPSENQVNGHGYSMELHFVNTSDAGAETVLAVFLQVGAYNASLQPILDAATADLTTAGSSTTISTPIDFSGLLPTNLDGWFYEGSLTTPVLSQPVNWLVLSTPITLSYAQLQQYEAVAKGAGFLPNARPVQPLDGRQVNQFNFDVNFQNQSVSNLNYVLARNS